MKEYKRLTTNNSEEYNPEYDFCIDCKYFGEPNGCNRPNGTCDNYDRFIEMYTRLTNLKDQEKKIEEMENFIIKTRNILRNILLTDSRPIKNTSKKDCYFCLMKLQELYKSNNSISDEDFLKTLFEAIIPENIVVITQDKWNDENHLAQRFGYDLGNKETAERDFNAIIKALEIKKASIMTHYGVKESVGADVAIRTVKELAKQFGVNIKEC